MADRASSGSGSSRESAGRLRSLHQLGGAVLVAAAIGLAAVPRAKAQAPTQTESSAQPNIPQGVWLLEGKAAVHIFDCEGLLCGRIVWMKVPRNPEGQLNRDKRNPNLAVRARELCGQTIIWGVRPDGPGRWKGGWFYNPDDGGTYRFRAELKSADVMVARIYSGIPLFGKTKTLTRISQDTSAGWCLAMKPPSSTPGGGESGPNQGP